MPSDKPDYCSDEPTNPHSTLFPIARLGFGTKEVSPGHGKFQSIPQSESRSPFAAAFVLGWLIWLKATADLVGQSTRLR